MARRSEGYFRRCLIARPYLAPPATPCPWLLAREGEKTHTDHSLRCMVGVGVVGCFSRRSRPAGSVAEEVGMSDVPFGEKDFGMSREAAAAAAELARDPEAFTEAFEAFRAADGERFRAALDRVGLLDRCRLICVFFCRKSCVGVCRRFCPGEPPDVTADEVRQFALTYVKLGEDELKRLVDALSADDVEAWKEELARLELAPFCHQVCHLLCGVRCWRGCSARRAPRSRV